MMKPETSISKRPVFTETFLLQNESPHFTNVVYIYKITEEERTGASLDYLNKKSGIFIEIIEEKQTFFVYSIRGSIFSVDITDEFEVRNFLTAINTLEYIHLDVTGISHNTWAVLLKIGFSMDIKMKIIYLEPLTYNSPPNKPHTYNLSLKLNPIKPIPGFAVLTAVGTNDFSFIPILGFERRRFELMITNVDPPQRSMYPIIGVPGFQLSFPFETYLVNKKKLLENQLYNNVRFAAANCPFRLYYTLHDIVEETRSDLYKIALIGTKPHAVGAVLFYLCSKSPVELLYDHPERKEGRSSGTFKLHVYHVDSFIKFLNK